MIVAVSVTSWPSSAAPGVHVAGDSYGAVARRAEVRVAGLERDRLDAEVVVGERVQLVADSGPRRLPCPTASRARRSAAGRDRRRHARRRDRRRAEAGEVDRRAVDAVAGRRRRGERRAGGAAPPVAGGGERDGLVGAAPVSLRAPKPLPVMLLPVAVSFVVVPPVVAGVRSRSTSRTPADAASSAPQLLVIALPADRAAHQAGRQHALLGGLRLRAEAGDRVVAQRHREHAELGRRLRRSSTTPAFA